MIVLLMGVSGAGKTTIGRLLAERLGAPFIEGDDYHPPANVAKMARGVPLEDEDRWPWLDRLNELLREHPRAVLACSALKESYRARLLAGIPDARIVLLHGDKALIAARVAARRHRYMPASLLDSQFAILEPPQDAIVIDVSRDPASCADQIARALSRP
ncbi:MAG TPA: gluconokinase [Burkholderiales bacterium]|nr:gluconokinase [Burkholderiales bacterium]